MKINLESIIIDKEDLDLLSTYYVDKNAGGYLRCYISTKIKEPYSGRKGAYKYLHYFIGKRKYGSELNGNLQIDHKDGNLLNVSRKNLIMCSPIVNSQNRTALNKNNTSGEREVYFRKDVIKRPWQSQYNAEGKHLSLGTYATQEEAIEAVKTYRAENVPSSVEYRKTNGI